MDEKFIRINFISCPDGAVRTLMPDAAVYALKCDGSYMKLTRKHMFDNEEVLREWPLPLNNVGYLSLLDMLGFYSAEHIGLLLFGIRKPEEYNIVKI